MPPQTRAAAHRFVAPTPLDALPLALCLRIFMLLPVDARLLAAAVCRSWRRMLAERSLWTRLDLSRTSGMRNPMALLRAAAARAGGQLEALRMHSWDYQTLAVLMGVLPANAGSVRELSLSGDDERPDTLAALLRAAPGLRLLETGVACGGAEALPVLRREPPFGPLRLTRLVLFRWAATDARELADALAAHTSLEHVTCHSWPAAPAESDVLAGALALLPHLRSLLVCHAPASTLARLLGCRALKSLRVFVNTTALLDSPASAAMLRAALRANTRLETLQLYQVDLWRDIDAAASVLAAVQAQPSLRELRLDHNAVPPEHAAAAGAALGALLSTVPSLQHLDVRLCNLGDAGLGPIMDALPRARCLHKLNCSENGMCEAFAREQLLPAVRACTSLRTLQADGRWGTVGPAVHEVQRLLRQRA
jgi:hypothetical protein